MPGLHVLQCLDPDFSLSPITDSYTRRMLLSLLAILLHLAFASSQVGSQMLRHRHAQYHGNTCSHVHTTRVGHHVYKCGSRAGTHIAPSCSEEHSTHQQLLIDNRLVRHLQSAATSKQVLWTAECRQIDSCSLLQTNVFNCMLYLSLLINLVPNDTDRFLTIECNNEFLQVLTSATNWNDRIRRTSNNDLFRHEHEYSHSAKLKALLIHMQVYSKQLLHPTFSTWYTWHSKPWTLSKRQVP